MDAFYERLIVRAATIDELLSADFDPQPGQKGDADLAGRRLAAWCRSCASGDWSLFERRLTRDGLTLAQALTRFASIRRRPSAAPPPWIADATWIEAAMQGAGEHAQQTAAHDGRAEPCAFEHLLAPVVLEAEARLCANVDARVLSNLTESARASLRRSLLDELSVLTAPALYERFDQARKAAAVSSAAVTPPHAASTLRYDQFVAEMKAGGFRRLLEDKPVLLRLIAILTRQWIETAREFLLRLDADLATIRRDILVGRPTGRVAAIEGGLSDPHNSGRSVLIVGFEDGAAVVYKPKDLRLDVAWRALIDRLNRSDAPVELRPVRAIARDGYGWTEFIAHAGCADADGCRRFFRRAGAWLALLHCFAATDMHQENLIAAGDHPVPIDLETVLQPTAVEHKSEDSEGQAFDAAVEMLANSVMTVGLLPAFARSPENKVFAVGGMTADWNSKTRLRWNQINSDEMRPVKTKETREVNPNLPHVEGRYGKFGDHVGDFVAGFEEYANFLHRQSSEANGDGLFDGFAAVPVRKVVRATRFYYMLLQRLKNHPSMTDGVLWSAQADFVARLADWESDSDPLWPLQRAERSALLTLNVPHFVLPSDGSEISDAGGISVPTAATSGLDRARVRTAGLDAREIAWQIEVIRHNTSSLAKAGISAGVAAPDDIRADAVGASAEEVFATEADRIAAEIGRQAIRRGPGAAWIGLDWLGDAEVFQLVCLGPELYNGAVGIALFLAAHAQLTGSALSRELALAGIARLRKTLRGRNAPRLARSLGIGAAAGLGSIVYALTVISKSLRDDALLADARAAAALFTDDLIAADQRLDVIGGSAGAILGLLRLHRDTGSADVLDRAVKCADHLVRQSRAGPEGLRSWVGQGFGPRALNGMSHGAAGFAYALASLAAAAGREDFAAAAAECIAFEDSSYDPERHNWPDLRWGGEPTWPCQWCHGAPGIGLARLATAKRGGGDARLLSDDARNAVEGVEQGWRGLVDTLCCGSLGSIEFFSAAGDALARSDLGELASRRLLAVLRAAAARGDYRWNGGKGRFNLGLFRGLAGVGYTALRRLDASLPNVLIWE
jgi:type 2 lantibiotic biosynthesis protein LanM